MTESRPSSTHVDAQAYYGFQSRPSIYNDPYLSKKRTGSYLSKKRTGSDSNPDSEPESASLAPETEPPRKPAPLVLYKVQYYDEKHKLVLSRENNEPMALQSTPSALKKAVIEVITEVRIIGSSESRSEEMPPNAIILTGTSLKINSPAIITALQSVIEYYPGQSFSEDSNTVPEPFACLIHHEEELKAYRDQFHTNMINSEVECCQRNADAYEHLGILQSVLFERSGKEVEAERQRHARGVATFEMLWLLFKPGTDVYLDLDEDENYDAFVIRSVSGGIVAGQPSPMKIALWSMTYDGDKIGRTKHQVELPIYDGEKDITSLKLIPCDFWKQRLEEGEETRPLRQKLEERGKMYFRLTQRQRMDYDGLGRLWPKKYFKGLTMVDTQVYHAEYGRPLGGRVEESPASGVTECLCHVCMKSKKRGVRPKAARYSSYDDIYPEKTKSLTDHQYFLCPKSLFAYMFKSRTWENLDLYCFSDPVFDINMIDTLVMEDGRRRLIKALASNYQDGSDQSIQSAHEPWTADFVAGKGEGKIFLLHGKPGVGKTYTAECIAAYTKRPLLSLTISDIGTVASKAEENLDNYFKRAKRWNAIILIDEADIYMERRENADLDRNSLVSGFLRAMENCQSILFLTTNRVGSFDDAFVSRIHISLYYRDFNEEDRRKIWTIFFNKLARDRKNSMHVPVETILYTTGPEVASLRWNGREIRNAFQTAVALADFDNVRNEDGKIVLRESHIQQIVHMSQEFKHYLRELHRGDEAKRADRQRIRYDEFDQTI